MSYEGTAYEGLRATRQGFGHVAGRLYGCVHCGAHAF